MAISEIKGGLLKQPAGDFKASKIDKPAEIKDQVEIENVNHEQAGVHKKWLILNYFAADCNLEPHQIKQIDELETIGSDENTHIVAQIDRGANPSTEIKPVWKNCQRYYIKQDTTVGVLESDMLEDQGIINMADPDVLRNFIVWGMKNFPADHVIVVLNDHGYATGGALADNSHTDFMPLPKIAQAFQEAEDITKQKVDIIAFDACTMATTEVAYELKNSADFMLASEDLIDEPGLTFKVQEDINQGTRALQENLKNRLDISPKEFTEKIVSANASRQKYVPTLSAADLSKMDTLKEKTDHIGELLLTKPYLTQKKEITEAMSQAQTIDGVRDHADLFDKIVKAIDEDKVEDAEGLLKKACKETSAFIKKEVIFANEHSDKYPGAYGLVIGTNLAYDYSELAFGKDSPWGKAMEEYYGKGVLDRDLPITWPDGHLKTEPQNKTETAFSMKKTEDTVSLNLTDKVQVDMAIPSRKPKNLADFKKKLIKYSNLGGITMCDIFSKAVDGIDKAVEHFKDHPEKLSHKSSVSRAKSILQVAGSWSGIGACVVMDKAADIIADLQNKLHSPSTLDKKDQPGAFPTKNRCNYLFSRCAIIGAVALPFLPVIAGLGVLKEYYDGLNK